MQQAVAPESRVRGGLCGGRRLASTGARQFQYCRTGKPCYRREMADETTPAAIERIERAIARIETAVSDRERANAALAERHEALRLRIEDAIRDLDAVIAGEPVDEEPLGDEPDATADAGH